MFVLFDKGEQSPSSILCPSTGTTVFQTRSGSHGPGRSERRRSNFGLSPMQLGHTCAMGLTEKTWKAFPDDKFHFRIVAIV